MNAPLGTREQTAALVISLATTSPYSHIWLSEQIDYLRTCGLFDDFDTLEAFARETLGAHIAPEAAARAALTLIDPLR